MCRDWGSGPCSHASPSPIHQHIQHEAVSSSVQGDKHSMSHHYPTWHWGHWMHGGWQELIHCQIRLGKTHCRLLTDCSSVSLSGCLVTEGDHSLLLSIYLKDLKTLSSLKPTHGHLIKGLWTWSPRIGEINSRQRQLLLLGRTGVWFPTSVWFPGSSQPPLDLQFHSI